ILADFTDFEKDATKSGLIPIITAKPLLSFSGGFLPISHQFAIFPIRHGDIAVFINGVIDSA
ncbi:hypothetical protein, partial [uncultured Moraxella sp.]|uniref:hypothetical protein n=1 Tax=uncultured Moraxella sp. TaxID=263769 RepID=UPI0025D70E30